MLEYFNAALFDVALFDVALFLVAPVYVVLYHYCTVNVAVYQSSTV